MLVADADLEATDRVGAPARPKADPLPLGEVQGHVEQELILGILEFRQVFPAANEINVALWTCAARQDRYRIRRLLLWIFLHGRASLRSVRLVAAQTYLARRRLHREVVGARPNFYCPR